MITSPPSRKGEVRDAASVPESDRLEEGMTTHSSVLAEYWESHGQRSLAGYSPWDRRVRHN